jgi:hypothetical protein
MIKNNNGPTRRTVLGSAMALSLPRLIGTAAAADAVDVAAAKKEGKVTLYTSAPLGAAQKVASAFQENTASRSSCFAPAARRCCAAS